MTQEEIIKLAAEAGFKWPDICETTIEQRLERFANLVVAAEREKRTGTQEFVTLQRDVAEQALEALINEGEFRKLMKPLIEKSIDSIRAALDQPQNHVSDAGNMVPAGWKLVPVEPTRDMLTTWIKAPVVSNTKAPGLYRSMLAAAPQPPTTEDPSVVQPQANQPAMTPIAQRKLDSLLTEGYTISGYSVYHEQKHQHGFVTGEGLVGWWKPEGMEYPQPQGEQEPVAWLHQCNKRPDLVKLSFSKREPVLTAKGYKARPLIFGDIARQLPKREPPTDEQIDAIADAMPGGLEGFLKGWGWRQFARAVLEATNNIK